MILSLAPTLSYRPLHCVIALIIEVLHESHEIGLWVNEVIDIWSLVIFRVGGKDLVPCLFVSLVQSDGDGVGLDLDFGVTDGDVVLQWPHVESQVLAVEVPDLQI